MIFVHYGCFHQVEAKKSSSPAWTEVSGDESWGFMLLERDATCCLLQNHFLFE